MFPLRIDGASRSVQGPCKRGVILPVIMALNALSGLLGEHNQDTTCNSKGGWQSIDDTANQRER